MPSEKRSHIRITSGSTRPHKTPRFGHKVADGDESPTADSSFWDISVTREQPAGIDVACQNSNSMTRAQSQTMRVAQVIAWPTSLAVVKNKVLCDCTPQKGAKLPEHVLRYVTSRFFHPTSRDGNLNIPPKVPYLHFGFSPYLNLQIFVFVPNLRLSNWYDPNSGYVHEETLKKWSDMVLMPSISLEGSRDGSWVSEGVCQLEGSDGRSLAEIWRRILKICMKTSGFQHPFLLLYSDGTCSPEFRGGSVEDTMQSFETSWHRAINMAYINSPEVDLMVDFSYGSPKEIKSLPMR